MKKIFIMVAVIAITLIGMSSCDDNTDVWSEHTLTQEEINEMNRQDSILNAQKNSIKADLVLEYACDITISKSSYDGSKVTIETDKIAEKLGITEEQFLSGIAEEDGAPEVKGFAIEGTTHADNASATNTGSYWGHWWNADGDVVNWGDDAMVFAEFDAETKMFHVGQYPNHLVEGQVIKFIEAVKYNDIRVAVVITATAKALGAVTAAVVGTQELTVNITPRDSYETDTVNFDLAKTLTDLGISDMADIKYVGKNEDGSYTQEAETGSGFWYNKSGFVSSYGAENVGVYTVYGEEGMKSNQVGVGQMPNTVAGGDDFTIEYGFLANNKIELLKIHVVVKEYDDPETAPIGDPYSTSKVITASKAYTDDYASVDTDVKELLRDAFKKTTYQIHKAISAGELKLYVGEVTATAPTYTSDGVGYWLDKDGLSAEWASGVIFCTLTHSNTDLGISIGHHPDNGVAGNTVTTKLIAVYNGVQVTFHITFSITATE